MIGRAIRLVERRFENIIHAEPLADFFDLAPDHKRAIIALDDAGPGDEKQALAGQFQISHLNRFHFVSILSK